MWMKLKLVLTQPHWSRGDRSALSLSGGGGCEGREPRQAEAVVLLQPLVTLAPQRVFIRMKWSYFSAAFLLLFAVATAEGEIWEEDDHEILIRSERGAKNREPCRYDKGPWSGCEAKNNMRSRSLTLKKGDKNQCEPTKIIQKKCKKACRYEKGTWSECNPQNKIVRMDTLKANSDASCEQSRQITKNCKGSKQGQGKGKAGKQDHENKRKGAKGGNRRNKD